MSIFGVVSGRHCLLSSHSGIIEGAKLLRNMGFELIMVEPGKADKGKNTGRYIIET
jgi:hypothetical protein